jgi:hypothetical protein
MLPLAWLICGLRSDARESLLLAPFMLQIPVCPLGNQIALGRAPPGPEGGARNALRELESEGPELLAEPMLDP